MNETRSAIRTAEQEWRASRLAPAAAHGRPTRARIDGLAITLLGVLALVTVAGISLVV